MSHYLRVIPRDLFNEANLLKCYGQLYLELGKRRLEDCLIHRQAYAHFDVWQDQDDGSLSIYNIEFRVSGKTIKLMRPLNSRRAYQRSTHQGRRKPARRADPVRR